jgi:hypothetical protein
MQLHMREGQDLSRMAVQICYELQEFYGSLSATASLGISDPAYNRTLESVLLHFRNLSAFFVYSPVRDDDVSARDYVPSWNPTNLDPVFAETSDDLNKKLAHISWKRLTIPRVDWPLDRIETAIDRLFEDFKKALTPPQDQWFSSINIAPKGAELLASHVGATASGLDHPRN